MSEKVEILYIASMDWSRLFNQVGETLFNDGKRATLTDTGDGFVRVSLNGPPIQQGDRSIHYDLLIPNSIIVRAVIRPAPRLEKDPGEEEITAVESPRRRVATGRPTEMG